MLYTLVNQSKEPQGAWVCLTLFNCLTLIMDFDYNHGSRSDIQLISMQLFDVLFGQLCNSTNFSISLGPWKHFKPLQVCNAGCRLALGPHGWPCCLLYRTADGDTGVLTFCDVLENWNDPRHWIVNKTVLLNNQWMRNLVAVQLLSFWGW